MGIVKTKAIILRESNIDKRDQTLQNREQLLEDKEIYTSSDNNEISIPITQNDNRDRKFNSQVVYPIIAQGDVIGSVILLSKDARTKMGETEQIVAKSAAGFLSSQMDV